MGWMRDASRTGRLHLWYAESLLRLSINTTSCVWPEAAAMQPPSGHLIAAQQQPAPRPPPSFSWMGLRKRRKYWPDELPMSPKL